MAFQCSELHKDLKEGKLKRGCFMIGDAACGSCEVIICPFSGALTPDQDNYNYAVSQLRITIECAFGRLVGRWGILWRAMRFSHSKCVETVMALCKLHNLMTSHDTREAVKCDSNKTKVDSLMCDCIKGHRDTRAAHTNPPKFDKSGRPVDMLNEDYRRRQSKRTSALRDTMVIKVKQAGVKRPRPN